LYLSGSINDFIGILRAAEELKANSVHFISPNIVFVLSGNKQDYLYAHTNLLIGQSILVPRSSFTNMRFYIENARMGKRREGSIFYQEEITMALFVPGKILFNESERLSMEVDIASLPLKKDVEFKLEESIQSSYNTDAPYLRVSEQDFKRLKSELSKHKKQFDDKPKNTSDNTIRIEEGHLVLYHKYREMEIRIETGIQTFAANEQFPDMSYSFSDQAVYLFYLMNRSQKVEEVVFLPRPNYCVIEGHLSNMVVKVRTMLKNDLYE
jgi:hypothetical protein